MCLFVFFCPIESGIHSYVRDFDSNGIVYALLRNFGRRNSTQTNIITTRSSDGEGKVIDILKSRLDREIVSGTKAEERSWWCGDLTENYALLQMHLGDRRKKAFPNRGRSVEKSFSLLLVLDLASFYLESNCMEFLLKSADNVTGLLHNTQFECC